MPYELHVNANGTPNTGWHLLDNTFTDQDVGIPTPARMILSFYDSLDQVCRNHGQDAFNTLATGEFELQITNLDRDDPPGYVADGVPRSATFNRNTLTITAQPHMPQIEVRCQTKGFNPRTTPIHWRLQCRHVVCRHQNHGFYRYRGTCQALDVEWQGRSNTRDFTLFEDASRPTLSYDYNFNDQETPVMGSHAILTVAVWPPGCPVMLLDYVHLRIGGTNPAQADVLAYIDRKLSGRDANVIHMVKAVFAHESNFTQFKDAVQTNTNMNFRPQHHGNMDGQPNCRVRFDWPDDPANYPFVTFDFGVGIGQYTINRGMTLDPEVAWDWRENIKKSINEFLSKLRATKVANQTWSAWALRAWQRYNGAGPQAEQYAQTLRASAEGQLVTSTVAPADANIADVAEPVDLGAPPAWPPLSVRFPEGGVCTM